MDTINTAQDGSNEGAKPEGKRFLIYGRVSTTGQNIESQLLPLRQYAQQRGLRVVEEIRDIGVSGAKASRAGLDRLMGYARKRQIDGVLVYRFDRFARSVRHLLDALQEFKSLGVAFLSYSENIDTTSPLGEALFAIVAAMAQLERDLIRERVVTGIARARNEGRKLGRPPVGVSAQRVNAEYQVLKSVRLVARRLRISPSTAHRLIQRASV